MKGRRERREKERERERERGRKEREKRITKKSEYLARYKKELVDLVLGHRRWLIAFLVHSLCNLQGTRWEPRRHRDQHLVGVLQLRQSSGLTFPTRAGDATPGSVD
jgi:uncharacterized membrane protein YbhN (UPF0104 family)